MTKILVTGSEGQLGKSLQHIAQDYPHLQFVFTDLSELDIASAEAVDEFLRDGAFDYCINCAAYTKVDQAEEEQELSSSINADGCKNLALACAKTACVLIQISTDFVFDGNKAEPYTETDRPNPLSHYGSSKLQGEQYVQDLLDTYFIIRTSWVYSEYGHNFLKTMIRLSGERSELGVVEDQIGSPTYAMDLAGFLLYLIQTGSTAYGIYHYSNEGQISWYDFAREIFKQSGADIRLNPIRTEDYPTAAQRPKNSTLSKARTKAAFDIEIPNWKESLRVCLNNMNVLSQRKKV
ncbi:dTDP-4-dehydrorhamnose reductase [Poritiphilus flavus]|uniref:dTDP-4-dehydrorhamnose reductase n=1 Tax=Poritiphilus flavus TaxID=2697053 RepID=A0A6L9E8F6_9FLAO|nr:dTDP-4-dehydrorhamnose reductase [Poritiphilus flavus]NAS10980.1 dTDP-4-dehydrorhamnose reductase [Poritiphilus flavus]